MNASDAYEKYIRDNGKRDGTPCDCDFHQGRWAAQNPPYYHNFNGRFPLRYAQHGDSLVDGCCNHPDRNLKKTVTNVVRMAPVGGMKCTKCNITNEYAGPNQKDGTYVCYVCR